MGETCRGDLVAVAAAAGPAQGAFAGRQRCGGAAQLGQDPIDVEQAGRFHHPGDHQVTEDLVAEGIEAQAGVDPGQGVVEQPVAALEHPRPRHQLLRGGYTGTVGEQRLGWRGNHLGPNRFGGDTQIQLALAVIDQQPLSRLDEQTQLCIITRRPHMTDDPAPTPDGFGDLDRSRTRCSTHPPNPDHARAAYRPKLVPSGCTKPKHHPCSTRYHPRGMTKVTQLRSATLHSVGVYPSV